MASGQDHGIDLQPPTMVDDITGEAVTMIACYMCRKRKIRCNRLYPECANCSQTQQTCKYPTRVSRPGPKIGSTQVARKRNPEAQDVEQPVKKAKPVSSKPAVPSTNASHQPLSASGPVPAQGPPPPPPALIQPPISPSASISPSITSNPSRDITSLSFILHPSLEPREPDLHSEVVTNTDGGTDDSSIISSACYALGVGATEMNQLIDEFFDTFTSFQLFRRSTFLAKLHHIGSSYQVKALCASVFMFSVRSRNSSPRFLRDTGDNAVQDSNTSEHFCDLALQYTDHAIAECDEQEEQLPLHLIQALVLISHWLLSKSAHGRAWRYLGLAVRSAYDLNLHMIDRGKGAKSHLLVSPERWALDEEKRRAWWALWEMDVFASVVRRRPMAINWAQNHTLLPAEDEKWDRSEPQESCFLSTNYVDRWKTLEKTKNKSPKAWYIVIDSLMKDAQLLSSPIAHDSMLTGEEDRDTFNQLMAMHNVLHCTTEMLPSHLKYENQFLNFGGKDVDVAEAPYRRARDAAIYSIHLMIQLARMMTYKFYVFRMRLRWPQLQRELAGMKEHTNRGTMPERQLGSIVPTNAVRQALTLYISASDNVVEIVQRTNGSHYKYVNPFIANTIWLAAAVQLLHRELIPTQSPDKVLISSNFELLCMTYGQFVKYWDMSDTLRSNLDTLEKELQSLQTLGKEMVMERRLSFDSQSRSRREVSTVSGRSAQASQGSATGVERPLRTTISLNNRNVTPSNRSTVPPQATSRVQDPTTRDQQIDSGDQPNLTQQEQPSIQNQQQQRQQQQQQQQQQAAPQAQMQQSTNDGLQHDQEDPTRVVFDNSTTFQTPSHQRLDLPFAFIHSPLPSLSGDVFGDNLRFDDGMRDMNERHEFYDNLNYVLSGSYG